MAYCTLMEQFTKGQYSGTVTSVHDHQGILSSITTYAKDNFNNTVHYHDNTHISLVIKGGCREKKKEGYERLPGTLTFYNAGEPHQILQVGRSSTHINLEIEPPFFRRYDIDENKLSAAIRQNPDGKFLLLKIQQELISAGAGSDDSIRMLLLDFVSGTDKIARSQPDWICRVHELLEAAWNEHPSLERLATEAGVHPVTVSKYFHKYFGCTLGQWLRKLKIEKALEMMSQENYSLSEITYHCGFADQSHFIRTFKQLTGFLPHKFQELSAG
jgi:AraC family transcriptional regulator